MSVSCAVDFERVVGLDMIVNKFHKKVKSTSKILLKNVTDYYSMKILFCEYGK